MDSSVTEAYIWLWILRDAKDVRIAKDFVATELPQYEYVESMYFPSYAKRLNNCTTRSNAAPVPLVFLFKKGNRQADIVRNRAKAEYRCPPIPYYRDIAKNNEGKLRMYKTELRMEFYLEMLHCFAVREENVLGINVGLKCMYAAQVSIIIKPMITHNSIQ